MKTEICRKCNEPTDLNTEAQKHSLCLWHYREYERLRRREMNAARSERVRTCPECKVEHQSPGYCGNRCTKCFKEKETKRKAEWRAQNRGKDSARVERYKGFNQEKEKIRFSRWNRDVRTPIKARIRVELKKFFITECGGKCIHCGFDKHYAALTFHHVDPSTKTSEVSPLISKAAGWKQSRIWSEGVAMIRSEVQKCILLCANCHHIEHADQIGPIVDG